MVMEGRLEEAVRLLAWGYQRRKYYSVLPVFCTTYRSVTRWVGV